MKTAACLLALCTLSRTAAAEAPPEYIGPPDCRVLSPYPVEHERVTWSGACKDGYAHGDGALTWYRDDVATSGYEGTMVRGQPEGFGTSLSVDRDRYHGAFKDGLPEGQGAIAYMLGGGYEGAFKSGRPHGHGVMTYAGSGRRHEGEFSEGRLVGTPLVAMADQPYIQHAQDPRRGSHIPRGQAYTRVPTHKPWGELTPEQQETVRIAYGALAPGDEPPYPLRGPAKLYAALAEAVGKLDVSGELRLLVLVGADGKARSVSVLGKPDPELMHVAAAAVMLEPYKPAVCDGKPCEMMYPFRFIFSVNS